MSLKLATLSSKNGPYSLLLLLLSLLHSERPTDQPLSWIASGNTRSSGFLYHIGILQSREPKRAAGERNGENFDHLTLCNSVDAQRQVQREMFSSINSFRASHNLDKGLLYSRARYPPGCCMIFVQLETFFCSNPALHS